MLGEHWRGGKVALTFLTRLPVGALHHPADTDLPASVPWWPLVGAIIGLLGALAHGLAVGIGLPPWPAVGLALTTQLLLTGALHEDGLADCADGFGGGRSRADKLRIMRDSQIGSFGASALILALLTRAGALVALAEPLLVGTVLVAAGAASRAVLPLVMTLLPSARAEGLAARAGQPHPGRALAALALGGLLALLLLGPAVAGAALAGAGIGALAIVVIARGQIGGQTGDVLGAVQQLAEIGFLLGAVVALGGGR